MEMAYRERWQAEIAELQRILSGFDLREECKWGKPCYTMDGKNIIIIQGFKQYCALGFFQGALLKDPKKLLVQLGQVQAARVMKFTSTKEIATKVTTIKAYVREAMAAEKAGMKVETKPPMAPLMPATATPRAATVPTSSFFGSGGLLLSAVVSAVAVVSSLEMLAASAAAARLAICSSITRTSFL